MRPISDPPPGFCIPRVFGRGWPALLVDPDLRRERFSVRVDRDSGQRQKRPRYRYFIVDVVTLRHELVTQLATVGLLDAYGSAQPLPSCGTVELGEIVSHAKKDSPCKRTSACP